MSASSKAPFRKFIAGKLNDFDLTNCCRICRCTAKDETGTHKLRPLFKGRRLTRIISNTIHIEIKDLAGLPRFICEKCLQLLKTFSIFQVDFRRSEEDFKAAIEARNHFHMDSLIAFSNAIEVEKQMENDQKNAALVTNLIKKKNVKSKSKLEKFSK